jgi:hypothetical protein
MKPQPTPTAALVSKFLAIAGELAEAIRESTNPKSPRVLAACNHMTLALAGLTEYPGVSHESQVFSAGCPLEQIRAALRELWGLTDGIQKELNSVREAYHTSDPAANRLFPFFDGSDMPVDSRLTITNPATGEDQSAFRFSDFPADHPARQHFAEDDCADVPGVGRVVVVPTYGDARYGRWWERMNELRIVWNVTRKTRDQWAAEVARRAEEHERQRAEDEELARLAPAAAIAKLRKVVEDKDVELRRVRREAIENAYAAK